MAPPGRGERILERLRRGERIEHCETVRRRKDGNEIDISPSYINRAKAWLLKGDAGRALSDLDLAIKLDESDAEAWMTRGVIRANEQDYARALADFEKAIKLNPRLAEVWHNRAVTLLRLERLPEAEADFARFRELGGRIRPEAERLWRELKKQINRK